MQKYSKHMLKFFLIPSKIAVVLAGLDYLNIVNAPFQLGANSWLLVAIILGIYAITTNQMRSSEKSS